MARREIPGLIITCLYDLMAVAHSGRNGGVATQATSARLATLSGYRFENDAAKAGYETLTTVGLSPAPPRHTLQLPTISGLPQQFDLVVLDGTTYYIIELKNRSSTQVEQLYAFIFKLLDYGCASRLFKTGHQFKGIFVSTSDRLNDNFRRYAIAYGVLPLAIDLPPCEVLARFAVDSSLRADIADLSQRLEGTLPGLALAPFTQRDAGQLLNEWRSIAQRCANHAFTS